MNCPKCRARSKVIDTNSDASVNHKKNKVGTVLRVRECRNCGHRWSTVELTTDDFKAYKATDVLKLDEIKEAVQNLMNTVNQIK